MTEKLTIISREDIRVQKIAHLQQFMKYYKEYNQNETVIYNCLFLKTRNNYREVEVASEKRATREVSRKDTKSQMIVRG